MNIATLPRGTAVLCLAALALAGCGGGSSKSSATSSTSAAATSSASSTTESASAASSSSPVASSPVASSPATTTKVSITKSVAPGGKPFTVTVPAGYKADPSKASGVVIAYYAGPVVANFPVNVNVTQEPAKGVSLQAAQRQAVTALKSVLKVTKLSSVNTLTLSGEKALSYSFEDTQGGVHLKQGQVVILHDGFAYVFTFTAPVAQFTAQSPKAVVLIRSLRFT